MTTPRAVPVLAAAGCVVLVTGCSAFGSSSTATTTASATTTVTATVTAAGGTVVQTATETASGAGPVTRSATDTSVPSDFVGTWYGHSRVIRIHADGSIRMSFRLYVICTAQRTTGCDRITGDEIHDGGTVVAHVSDVVNPTTMIMTVTSTSAPRYVPYGEVRVGRDTAHDAVAIFAGALSGTTFCGNQSPDGYCGA